MYEKTKKLEELLKARGVEYVYVSVDYADKDFTTGTYIEQPLTGDYCEFDCVMPLLLQDWSRFFEPSDQDSQEAMLGGEFIASIKEEQKKLGAGGVSTFLSMRIGGQCWVTKIFYAETEVSNPHLIADACRELLVWWSNERHESKLVWMITDAEGNGEEMHRDATVSPKKTEEEVLEAIHGDPAKQDFIMQS